jgi:hypothetical protein
VPLVLLLSFNTKYSKVGFDISQFNINNGMLGVGGF